LTTTRRNCGPCAECFAASRNIVIEGFTEPHEALERFRPSPFDVAFLDIEMPQMNGVDLATRLRAINPTLPLIFATGGAPEPLRRAAIALAPSRFS